MAATKRTQVFNIMYGDRQTVRRQLCMAGRKTIFEIVCKQKSSFKPEWLSAPTHRRWHTQTNTHKCKYKSTHTHSHTHTYTNDTHTHEYTQVHVQEYTHTS